MGQKAEMPNATVVTAFTAVFNRASLKYEITCEDNEESIFN